MIDVAIGVFVALVARDAAKVGVRRLVTAIDDRWAKRQLVARGFAYGESRWTWHLKKALGA